MVNIKSIFSIQPGAKPPIDIAKIEEIKNKVVSEINDWYYGSPGDLESNSQFVDIVIIDNHVYIDIDTVIVYDSASEQYLNYDWCKQKLDHIKNMEEFLEMCKIFTRKEFLEKITKVLHDNGFRYKEDVYDPYTKSYWLRYEYKPKH